MFKHNESIHQDRSRMNRKLSNSIDLCNKPVLRPKPGVQVWCPDLNSLLAPLNLANDDSDTISMSSSESYDVEEEKMVRFGSVEIREYEVTQGDHPFCKDGLALTLDWKYRRVASFLIEESEINKSIDCQNYATPIKDDDQYNSTTEMRDDNVDYINTRPRRLSYFERRLVLEQVGFTVEDCYGEIRSSIWVGVDDQLPPDNDDDDSDDFYTVAVTPAAA
mmetsp:Transcript_33497/g.50528  ORF Transcript_33497/g.50528 Transcript_33497/m.50528 type:complete len:220 (+) Transcript_33497:76-735(+)